MPKEKKFSFVVDVLIPLILIGFVIFTGYLFYNFLIEYDVIKNSKNKMQAEQNDQNIQKEQKVKKENFFTKFISNIFSKEDSEKSLNDEVNKSSSQIAKKNEDSNIIVVNDNKEVNKNIDNKTDNKKDENINKNITEETNKSNENSNIVKEKVETKTEQNKNEIKYIEKEYFIYLVDVDEKGEIIFRKVKVLIKYIDSPIYELLKTLISYKSSNYKNLVPPGTEIKGAWIKNGICYVDFNKNFLNNNLGYKAVEAQIYQIVNTVMQFKNVKGVIIYIDGKQRKYFSEEGFIMDIVFTAKEKL